MVMQDTEFKQNITEWIITINQLLKQMREDIDDVILAQDEDLHTLSYQYQVLKDLRRRVINLEKNAHRGFEYKVNKFLKKQEGGKIK